MVVERLRRRESLPERRRRVWLELIEHAAELHDRGVTEPDRRLLGLARAALALDAQVKRAA